MIEELAHMMARSERRARPLDIIPVPKQHVRRLYEAMAEIEECREKKAGFVQARLAMWALVAEIVPASKGKDCTINTNNVLAPLIEITSKGDMVKVGSNNVTEVHEIPAAKRHRFYELVEQEQLGGLLEKYDLWTFIDETFPDARLTSRDTDEENVCICVSNELVGIVVKKKV